MGRIHSDSSSHLDPKPVESFLTVTGAEAQTRLEEVVSPGSALSSPPSLPLASTRPTLRPRWRTALIIASYLTSFIILDLVAHQLEEFRGIVAWYPPAGLTYTLLLVFGARYTPAVTIALFISSIFVYRMPQPPYALFLWALIISSIYGVAAAILRRRLDFDWRLRKSRDVASLVAATVLVSALLAVLSVSSSALSDGLPQIQFLRAVFLWWIGEMVGVLTVTPFLLIHVMPWMKRFADGQPVRLFARRTFPPLTLSIVGQAISLAFLFLWVFAAPVSDEFRPMLLFSLPLIWIALDHGFTGVTSGILALNFGLTLALWVDGFDLAQLGELQLLMIVNCIVGLLMGSIVSNREQAEAEIARLLESERLSRQLAEALARTASRLNAQLNLNIMVKTVCEQAVLELNVQAAWVGLSDPQHDVLAFTDSVGLPPAFAQCYHSPPLAAYSESLQRTGPTVVVPGGHGLTDFPNAAAYAAVDARTVATAGMLRAGQVVGSLSVITFGEPREFTHDELALLQGLASQAAQAIVNARSYDDARRRAEDLEALREIDNVVLSSFDLKLMLPQILRHAQTRLNVDAAAVLLLDVYSPTLTFAAGRGFRAEASTQTHLRLDESNAGRAALERQIVSIPDVRTMGDAFTHFPLLKSEGFVAYYAAPLISKGQVKGVLEVFHRTPFLADDEWRELFQSLAAQTALAVDNATLFNDLQRSSYDMQLAYEATIEGWSRALDLRDKETEGHALRVTELTIQLARAMGMSDTELAHVRRGALLHDIGKMGVPDGILLKPGKLTDEEWVQMRKHPQFAYEMLSPINYLRHALDIPYCHHEKWDGSGYPQGLKGEQIPLAARLFAVVDVWDALRSDRPYRAAWPEERVREYLREQVGLHFDPKVVAAFLQMVE